MCYFINVLIKDLIRTSLILSYFKIREVFFLTFYKDCSIKKSYYILGVFFMKKYFLLFIICTSSLCFSFYTFLTCAYNGRYSNHNNMSAISSVQDFEADEIMDISVDAPIITNSTELWNHIENNGTDCKIFGNWCAEEPIIFNDKPYVYLVKVHEIVVDGEFKEVNREVDFSPIILFNDNELFDVECFHFEDMLDFVCSFNGDSIYERYTYWGVRDNLSGILYVTFDGDSIDTELSSFMQKDSI